MDRRHFLAAGALGALAARFPDGGSRSPFGQPPAFDLEEATVADLGEAMASGRLTSRAITQRYLDRIAAVDRPGDGRPG